MEKYDLNSPNSIIQQAINESKLFTWNDFREHLLTEEGYDYFTLIMVKRYIHSYLYEIQRALAALQGENLKGVDEVINTFFTQTFLNHLLDWSEVSYVIQNDLKDFVGFCEKHRIKVDRLQLSWNFLNKAWSQIQEGLRDELSITELNKLNIVGGIRNNAFKEYMEEVDRFLPPGSNLGVDSSIHCCGDYENLISMVSFYEDILEYDVIKQDYDKYLLWNGEVYAILVAVDLQVEDVSREYSVHKEDVPLVIESAQTDNIDTFYRKCKEHGVRIEEDNREKDRSILICSPGGQHFIVTEQR